MRKCLRCETEMVENLTLATADASCVIVKEKGMFKGSLGKLNCAVCPNCGYVENYLENTDRVKETANKNN